MNLTAYFPPPPGGPPKKPSMSSPIPPDKPKKPRRPKGSRLEDYDYGQVCNLKHCKDKTIICPECLKNGIKRLGHRKLWQGNVKKRTKDKTEVFISITHGHFALRKNTQVPEPNDGRNLFCEIPNTRRMVSIAENCDVSIRIKGGKKMPNWIRKCLDGED